MVIPAHAEATSIGEVVRQVRSLDPRWEVIVVDDGSADGTGEAARAAGATVVVHPYNLGNGASIKSGARSARGEVLVFLDADGQHPPASIPRLLEHIPRFDMVVGARTSESKVSRFRGLGNWLLVRYARWLTGFPIVDLTSGYRAVKRRHFMELIHLLPQRYSYPTTITIAMFSGGHFVHYVPMPEIQRRHQGQSGLRPFRDGLRFLHIVVRITLLFSPMRVFLPLTALFFAAGTALGSYQYLVLGGLQEGAGMLWMSGFTCLLIGLISEQIAELRRRPAGTERD